MQGLQGLLRCRNAALAGLQICFVLCVALPVVGSGECDQGGIETGDRLEITHKVRSGFGEPPQALVAEHAGPDGRLFAVRTIHIRVSRTVR